MSNVATYIPPIHSKGSVVGSVVSATASSIAADAELARIAAFESEEAAAIRRQKEEEQQKKWTYASSAFAGLSMSTALVAMYIEASMIAYLAFIFPLVLAPLAISQRRRINKLPTLKQEMNHIRVLVNDFAIENDILKRENSKLEQQVNKLHEVEESFDRMVQQSGGDVQKFRGLALENGEIQREMKRVQETKIMQQLLTAVLQSDRDGNFHLSDAEMETLLMRLRVLAGVRGNIDEGRLRAAFAASPTKSMMTMYKLTADLLEEEELELSQASSRSSRRLT